MAEKMLVTQALDERDLLVKKITDKIKKLRLVDTKKKNEDMTMEDRVTPEEFGKTAQSAWQQIMDLIERYQRLDAAIVASNAENKVETAFGTFTVAGAIALRARLKGNGIYDEDGMFERKIRLCARRFLAIKTGPPDCLVQRVDGHFALCAPHLPSGWPVRLGWLLFPILGVHRATGPFLDDNIFGKLHFGRSKPLVGLSRPLHQCIVETAVQALNGLIPRQRRGAVLPRTPPRRGR